MRYSVPIRVRQRQALHRAHCQGRSLQGGCFRSPDEAGGWRVKVMGQPRSHYDLFCSEKDNHAGYGEALSEPASERTSQEDALIPSVRLSSMYSAFTSGPSEPWPNGLSNTSTGTP